jgi:Zn-dependent membrane protease YugP
MYLLFLAPFMLLGFWAQNRVKGSFAQWSQVRSSSGRTGAEVARAILDRNGLQHVEIKEVAGQVSDHYDPRSKSIGLSPEVFRSNSVAAVSVAAHEVGHAIQHSKAYAPLAIRTAIFPVAAFGSGAFTPLFFLGVILFFMQLTGPGSVVMLVALALFAVGVLFQIVTLPVEFDASRRAKAQLQELTLVPAGGQEAVGASKVLSAAALTYVAGALMGVAQLAYFALQFFGGND